VTLKKLVNADVGTADLWGGDDQDNLTTALDLGESYKYLVVKSGSTYYVKGSAGQVAHSGSTPATEAQWALDNLTAARTNKEIVAIRGNISLTGVTLPSYTVLDLRGAKLTQTSSTNTNFLINNDTSGGNTQIEIFGGAIDGNLSGQTADGSNYDTRNTINFTKVTNSNIHNIYIANSNSNGVFLGLCNNITVDRCSIITPRKCGIRMDATSSSTPGAFISATHNYMYNLPESFFTSCTSTDLNFSNNLCDICATNGVNICAPRSHVNNNIIRTCDRAGITMGGEATPFGAGDYTEVIGNTLWECKGGGIFSGVTQGGDYVRFINNLCKGHPTLQDTASGRAYGMRIRGNYCLVEGNVVFGWGRSGLLVSGAASTSSFDSRPLSTDRLQIKNNTFHTNGQFAGTEASDSLKCGISVLGSTTETAYNSNIKITGNISYNNINYGLHYKNTTGIVIEGNDLASNNTSPILDGGSNV
jgi:hypothetical protein